MDSMLIIEHNNGRREYLEHNFFSSSDTSAKRETLRLIKIGKTKKSLNIYCCCTSPKVEMYITHSEKSGSYSIKSFPGKAQEHVTECLFSSANVSSLSTDTTYEKGYVEKDGKIEVKLHSHDFKKATNNNQQANLAQPPSTGVRQGTIGNSRSKSTIYALTKRLVTEAWNKSIYNSKTNNFPMENKIQVYDSLRKDVLWKYSIGKDQLNSIFYSGAKVAQIFKLEQASKSKSAAFSILLLENDISTGDSDEVLLSLRSPKSADSIEVVVPRHLYLDALKAINNIPAPYFIGGFLTYRGPKKPPEFLSFCLLPISDYGAPIESSYERSVFNTLAAEKRKVVRPMSHNIGPSWSGFVPDGLFIDTNPKTILEIFGMSPNHLEYHEKRQIKIDHFNSLYPQYTLWYWDAFNGTPLPAFPEVSK